MVDNWETDGRWMCLGDSGSSGLEGSVDLGVDWVVGESSVENPEMNHFQFQYIFFKTENLLLVMSLRDNRGQWSGSSLPWQHLIFNLSWKLIHWFLIYKFFIQRSIFLEIHSIKIKGILKYNCKVLPISFLRSRASGGTDSQTDGYHNFDSPSPAAHRASWPDSNKTI